VVQDVAKKKGRKETKGSNEPTGKKFGPPKKPVVFPEKNTFLAGSPTFLFFFLLQLCRYDKKTTSWNNLLPPLCPQI